jgi:hypothetical protein
MVDRRKTTLAEESTRSREEDDGLWMSAEKIVRVVQKGVQLALTEVDDKKKRSSRSPTAKGRQHQWRDDIATAMKQNGLVVVLRRDICYIIHAASADMYHMSPRRLENLVVKVTVFFLSLLDSRTYLT